MKKNLIPNIIGAALCILLLPIAIVNITLAVRSCLHPDRVAMVFGLGPLIVETGSMSPAFDANDLILVKKTDAGKLCKDDIIAFYDSKGVIVSHRVIGFDSDENGARTYITKGDANNTHDRDPVPAARVAGRVVKVYPGGGRLMLLLRQPWVLAVLIGVPVGLYIGIGTLVKYLAGKKGKEVTAQADEP
jgi:signal peptidase